MIYRDNHSTKEKKKQKETENYEKENKRIRRDKWFWDDGDCCGDYLVNVIYH